MTLPSNVAAGAAVYTPAVLKLYDVLVLGLSNPLLWKCSTRRLLGHYDEHISGNHLDVGVGTGYFLDRCRFPSAHPRIALLDLNRHTLDFAASRIARYQPDVYRGNVLAPIAVHGRKFDSVGLNYLLHCLPGAMETKACAFDRLAALMNPGGVLFGATLLQGGVAGGLPAKSLMRLYNLLGIFSNRQDSMESLEHALRQRFQDVRIDAAGAVALFSARLAQ